MIKINLARHAGFCFGVKRAVNLALATARENAGDKITTLGPLIHNPQVIAELARQGISEVKTLSAVKSGIAIVCSHGMHPLVLDKLRKKKIAIIDATCPFVGKIEKIVSQLKKEKSTIIIVGDKHHPEVKALTGYAGKNTRVIENQDQARKLPFYRKLGVVAQTTQSVEKYALICRVLADKSDNLKIYNTICDATQKRQQDAVSVARRSGKIIVVGGYNSANTKRLVKLCQGLGKPTLHIEEAGELPAAFLKGVKSVGILAGASTPDWIIKAVINKIKTMEA